MKKSDKLFELIRTMNRSEKRFFRLQSGIHAGQGNTRYLDLFDAVDAQEEYDEASLRAQFGGDAVNFAALKRYLYQSLLKALYLFNLEDTPEAQVSMLNAQAIILDKKGLTGQAMTLLKKARGIADRNQLAGRALESLLQSFSHLFSKDAVKFEQQLEEVLEQISINRDMFFEYIETLPVIKRTYIAMTKLFHPRNADELAEYESIMRHPMMQNPFGVSSVLGRRNMLLSLATCHRMVNNTAEALHYYEELYQLSITFPNLSRYRSTVSAALYNTCLSSIEAEDADKFAHYHATLIDECRSQIARGHDSMYWVALILPPYMSSVRGEFELALEQLDSATREHELADRQLDSENTLFVYHLRSCAYFGIGKYDKAVDSLNAYFSYPNVRQLSTQRYYGSRLLLLLLHFEMGNIDTLESLLPSVWSQLQVRGQVYRLEDCLRRLFKHVIQLGRTNLSAAEWKPYYEEMQMLKRDRLEYGAIKRFDFAQWVRAKYEGRTWAEVVREEFGSGCVFNDSLAELADVN